MAMVGGNVGSLGQNACIMTCFDSVKRGDHAGLSSGKISVEGSQQHRQRRLVDTAGNGRRRAFASPFPVFHRMPISFVACPPLGGDGDSDGHG